MQTLRFLCYLEAKMSEICQSIFSYSFLLNVHMCKIEKENVLGL
jgi:hypothetical protein